MVKEVEIEAKFKVHDLAYVQAQIIKLGGQKVDEITQQDDYFHNSHIRAQNCYLRTRYSSEGQSIALHYMITDFQFREIEVSISNVNKIKEIFTFIGLQLLITVRKNRLLYKLGESLIMLDKVDKLGSFIEIESPTTQVLEECSKLLNYDLHNSLKNKSYADLLLAEQAI